MKLLDKDNKPGILTYTVFVIFIAVFLLGIFTIVMGVFYPKSESKDCEETLTLVKDEVKAVYVLQECTENK